MGMTVTDEYQCQRSGYSIDMLVEHGQDVCALEFDGPSHFLTCGAPTGSTSIKRRHLALLGYSLVSVPFWEWYDKVEKHESEIYLRSKIHAASQQAGGGGGGGGGELEQEQFLYYQNLYLEHQRQHQHQSREGRGGGGAGSGGRGRGGGGGDVGGDYDKLYHA
jgi:hypothetical protein